MKRREFIKAVTAGFAVIASGACGYKTYKPLPHRGSAIEYLTKKYNEASKGQVAKLPKQIIASPELFDAFKSELKANERFVSSDVYKHDMPAPTPCLKFKAATMYKNNKLRGWDCIFVENA